MWARRVRRFELWRGVSGADCVVACYHVIASWLLGLHALTQDPREETDMLQFAPRPKAYSTLQSKQPSGFRCQFAKVWRSSRLNSH